MRYIFLLVLLCISFRTKEAVIPIKEIMIIPSKADFKVALKHILNHEGYYVNHPDDRGKETYRGISRKYNNSWNGWKYIDNYKKKNGTIKWNQRIDDQILDYWVLDFYLEIWISEHFYLIKDQKLANYLFDFRINATKGASVIKNELNQFGCGLKKNNELDTQTIDCINKIRPNILLDSIQNRRVRYYRNIVKRDSSQIKFMKHWLKRSKF